MMSHYTELIKKFGTQHVESIASFFHEHGDQIDTLIQLYQAYNKQVLNAQTRRIEEIKQAISNLTEDQDWRDEEGLELSYDQFSPAMVITGGFSSAPGDALDTFNIYLTTPDNHSWSYYEDRLISRYPQQEPIIHENRTILPIAAIPGNDANAIVNALVEVYNFLSELTVHTFLHSLTSH
jgi:hypothetical protein